MRHIGAPEFPKLRGKEAKRALLELIREYEEERGKDLTDKQANALVKIAKGLISSIEMEIGASPSNKKIKEFRLSTRLKRTITEHVP